MEVGSQRYRRRGDGGSELSDEGSSRLDHVAIDLFWCRSGEVHIGRLDHRFDFRVQKQDATCRIIRYISYRGLSLRRC